MLPTSGSARFASGLSVQTFLKGVHVIDYDEAALREVAAKVVTLADAESGEIRDFDITERVRHDYAVAAAAHRADVGRTIRRCGGSVMSLRTDRDWVNDTVRFVGARRRGMAAGVG